MPCVKQIDTLAAEFPAQTNYLYMTYHGDEVKSYAKCIATTSTNHYLCPQVWEYGLLEPKTWRPKK
jgi:hypothetical protein